MHTTIFAAMHAAGLAPAKAIDIPPDGRLIRFRVDGDKPGSRNGWAVLHTQPVLAGAFGSWRTGASHTWCAQKTGTMSPQDRAELQRQLRAMQKARADELARVRSSARERAARLWQLAKPATDAHPYLQSKGVRAIGLRQLRETLLVPVRDVHGDLHSLQFIDPMGNKRFLTGGRVEGCYCGVGRVQGLLMLAEGYATGATLFMALGHAVAITFNAGNLSPVARALRAKFPSLRMIICADNDAATPGNPGVSHARQAAKAAGALLVVPSFVGVV